jgi:hypothetical protein
MQFALLKNRVSDIFGDDKSLSCESEWDISRDIGYIHVIVALVVSACVDYTETALTLSYSSKGSPALSMFRHH